VKIHRGTSVWIVLAVVVYIVVILACGGVDQCTVQCQNITDDDEWDQCMLECKQALVAQTPTPTIEHDKVETVE